MNTEERRKRNRTLSVLARCGSLKARQFLITENIPLGVKMARRVARKFDRYMTNDELVSLSSFGLIYAADGHVPGRCQFSTWASKNVIGKSYYQLYIEAGYRKKRRPLPRNDPARSSPKWSDKFEWKRLTFVKLPRLPLVCGSSVGRNPAVIAEENDLAESRKLRVQTMLDVLNPVDREIVSLYFGLGGNGALTMSEIGTILNVSRQRISQRFDRAMKKLKAPTPSLTTHSEPQPCQA